MCLQLCIVCILYYVSFVLNCQYFRIRRTVLIIFYSPILFHSVLHLLFLKTFSKAIFVFFLHLFTWHQSRLVVPPCPHYICLLHTTVVGTNFKSWHRAIRIALGAKQKLGFTEGIITVSNRGPLMHEQWKKCDFVITSSILNSIFKELVDGFIYTASAQDLWLEVIERFWKCNRLMNYQLYKKISSMI